ncbi:hypothetical protein [Terrihalobacillus insolitus]|uniref:hypothetical protein n=1 Tax=Terrihalobacillus insolitus TaxID=2950438 RepID=UPI002340E5FE|nr:hypothetical protein [Terrihalobacillus insolitus]MDC3414750.1 hypothetical protein [Terrihalobacillus insolitus]
MKKFNKKGRILFFSGIWVIAFGLALGLIEDVPVPFSTLSIPLITIGVILLIASNFYKRNTV